MKKVAYIYIYVYIIYIDVYVCIYKYEQQYIYIYIIFAYWKREDLQPMLVYSRFHSPPPEN